jgi:hypothetical protein
VTATLARHWWGAYTLVVRDTASGLRYEYPLEFSTRAAGLAFAREAGIADVRVIG